MRNLLIRYELPEDIGRTHDIIISAFLDAPHANGNEQLIVNTLRDSGALTLSLVAQYNDELVGHAAISPVTISDESCKWYGLGPLSVIPEWQRQGCGTRLTQRALEELQKYGAQGCVVLGNPRYYSRFGFQQIDELTLSNVPAEYFLALPFGQHRPRGNVTYHSSFSAKI